MTEHLGRILRSRAATALCVAGVLSACVDFIGPGEPLEYPDGVKYFDEAMFRPIWNELESCSKLEGSLRKVTFYYVPRVTLTPIYQEVRTLGMYFPEANRIFIVQSSKADRDVIRHEMMHALLRETAGHPPKYFGKDGVCGVI